MAPKLARTILLTLCLASPALGCAPPSGADATIRIGGIDQQRLTATILEEVNFVRCRAGRSGLARAPASLTEVARGHSRWMASARSISHTGGRATGRTLSDRVRRSGLRPRVYAENLAFLPRFRGGGRLVDSASCQVSTAQGVRTGGHSYRSLAREVVQMWMDSAGHRKNILSSKQRAMSAAATITPEGRCGRFWITQIFTG